MKVYMYYFISKVQLKIVQILLKKRDYTMTRNHSVYEQKLSI